MGHWRGMEHGALEGHGAWGIRGGMGAWRMPNFADVTDDVMSVRERGALVSLVASMRMCHDSVELGEEGA